MVDQRSRGPRGDHQPSPEAGPERIRLGVVGFGRVGRAVVDLALMRPWIDVVTVVARRDERHGQLVSDVVPAAPAGLRLRTDIGPALRDARPDVVIMATTSRLHDVLGQLESVTRAGVRVIISTAEELAFVQEDDGETARAVHALIRETGATVVATGVNPGFVLDLWPLVLSGLAWDIERIEARRVVDVSVFAPHTRSQLGIDHDRDAFEAGVADGSIAGHLGFRESLRLLCSAMGRSPDRITIRTEPVVAEREVRIADGAIEPGRTVGATQRAVAWCDGQAWISIELSLHVAPAEAGIRTVDETIVHGRHGLHATLDPGAGAIMSTAARLVNTIPVALRADAGLYGPGQLPVAAPWLAVEPPSR